MKILVTGAAGFIGSHVVERLLSRGEEVIGLDDFNDYYDPAIKRHNIAKAQTMKGFLLIEGDIRDEGLILNLFRNNHFDTVIHLAARAGVRPSIKNPVLYETANVMGLLNLLEAGAKYCKPYFIFASSSSVYGISPRLPWREDDPVDCPISPYAITKRSGELLCSSYFHSHGVRSCSLRFFTVYGPRQRPEMAIHKFFDLIMHGQPVTVFGDGTAERDFTYVDDIVDGVIRACDAQFECEIINLGGANKISVADLIKNIGEVVGTVPQLIFGPPQVGDVPFTWADSTKAKHLLGQSPSTPLMEGLKKQFEWIKQKPIWRV